jgi:hypothetical protein
VDGVPDVRAELDVVEAPAPRQERPDLLRSRRGNRDAERAHRVPDAEEADRRPVCHVGVLAVARRLAVGVGPAKQARLVAARPGRLGAGAVERERVVDRAEVLGPQDAAVADQAREAPSRERAAAEAEEVEVVAGHVVLREVAVRGEHVVRQPDADRAAAHAVDRTAGPDAALVEDALLGPAVVVGDREGELGDVARRDLAAVELVGAVPRTVAGDDDALAHRGNLP